jgi:pimeloyl-ACP methyl ester carboxylesterase
MQSAFYEVSMGRRTLTSIAVLALAAAAIVWLRYRHDLAVARARVGTGSAIAQTPCGPIEYAVRGAGRSVLIVHGAGGGFDQGLALARPLLDRGFQVISPSRFGYLRSPMPAVATVEAQADAYVCLLDALGVSQVAVVGVSAGGPSAMQLCLRHPENCVAMALVVPLAWRPSGMPAPPPPALAALLIDKTLRSDFVFWAMTRLARGSMVESILGTPMADVEAASREEQRRIYGMFDLIQPISQRHRGLRHDSLLARSLRRYELERLALPALVMSVEDDLYGTYAGARYTAGQIRGARFVGLPRGGHMWAGHAAELESTLIGFLDGALREPGLRKEP